MNWEQYWNQYPSSFKETQFYEQVGQTICGKPISSDHLNTIVDDIKNALNITRNDVILDMCCGNGLLTWEISKFCDLIVGIDFSKTLIEIANKYFSRENISYYCMSILDKNLIIQFPNKFSKVFMYGGLQYFDITGLSNILEQVKGITIKDAVIFIGFIPDKDKIWDFYDTDEKVQKYFERKNANQEYLGTWWSKKDIAEICTGYGFEVEFNIPTSSDASYYRFDVRLRRIDQNNAD